MQERSPICSLSVCQSEDGGEGSAFQFSPIVSIPLVRFSSLSLFFSFEYIPMAGRVSLSSSSQS